MAAVSGGNNDIVGTAYKKNKDLSKKNGKGWNVFHFAAEAENADGFEFLIEKLENNTMYLLSEADEGGDTPFMLAQGCEKIEGLLEQAGVDH